MYKILEVCRLFSRVYYMSRFSFYFVLIRRTGNAIRIIRTTWIKCVQTNPSCGLIIVSENWWRPPTSHMHLQTGYTLWVSLLLVCPFSISCHFSVFCLGFLKQTIVYMENITNVILFIYLFFCWENCKITQIFSDLVEYLQDNIQTWWTASLNQQDSSTVYRESSESLNVGSHYFLSFCC